MANEKNLDLSTLQGAFERYDNSLADVAKSGDYNDLLNLPSSGGGVSDYAELTGAPFARTDVPVELLDETLVSSDYGGTGSGNTWSKRIQNNVHCKEMVDLFLKKYPDGIPYSDKQVFDDPSIEMLLYGNGTLVENTHLTIYSTNFDSYSFPDPETAETITVKTGTYHLVVENDAYDPNTYGSEPNYGRISFEFTIYDIVPQHNQYSIEIWPNTGWTLLSRLDTVRVVMNGVNYEFSLDQHSKINNIGYNNLNDVPLEKSYTIGDTPESITLTSADRTEMNPNVFVWEKNLSLTLCDNLTAAIKGNLSPLPTDYLQAVEVPNNIMKVDVYINGSTTPSIDVTPYVYANSQNEPPFIVFKYQDNYLIGGIDLGRKNTSFNLEYEDSQVLGTVTSIKYEITGNIVSWVAKNDGDVFDIDILSGGSGSDQFAERDNIHEFTLGELYTDYSYSGRAGSNQSINLTDFSAEKKIDFIQVCQDAGAPTEINEEPSGGSLPATTLIGDINVTVRNVAYTGKLYTEYNEGWSSATGSYTSYKYIIRIGENEYQNYPYDIVTITLSNYDYPDDPDATPIGNNFDLDQIKDYIMDGKFSLGITYRFSSIVYPSSLGSDGIKIVGSIDEDDPTIIYSTKPLDILDNIINKPKKLIIANYSASGDQDPSITITAGNAVQANIPVHPIEGYEPIAVLEPHIQESDLNSATEVADVIVTSARLPINTEVQVIIKNNTSSDITVHFEFKLLYMQRSAHNRDHDYEYNEIQIYN